MYSNLCLSFCCTLPLTLCAAKLGHCVPSTCSHQDVRIGFQNFLDHAVGPNILSGFVYNCHTAEETIALDAGDWAVGTLILILVSLILIGTLIDLWLNVLQLDMIPDSVTVFFQVGLFPKFPREICFYLFISIFILVFPFYPMEK